MIAGKKAPNAIDVHVGHRVRAARLECVMSQETLGEALSLTFQQVQKYEKGTNRIGSSRLVQIAAALRKPVEWFFAGAPGTGSSPTGAPAREVGAELMAVPHGRELALAFLAIDDNDARHALLVIARTLAKRGGHRALEGEPLEHSA